MIFPTPHSKISILKKERERERVGGEAGGGIKIKAPELQQRQS